MHKFYLILLIFIFFNTNCIAQVESNKDWQLLIPSDGLNGWHYYQDKKSNKTGWFNENGVLVFNSSFKKGNKDNSLVTNLSLIHI